MNKEPCRIRIAPASDIAVVIREAVADGTCVEVYAGDETYQVEVKPMGTPKSAQSLRRLAHEMAGALATVDIADWHSGTAAEQWVDELRKADTFPAEPPLGMSAR